MRIHIIIALEIIYSQEYSIFKHLILKQFLEIGKMSQIKGLVKTGLQLMRGIKECNTTWLVKMQTMKTILIQERFTAIVSIQVESNYHLMN